MANQKRGREIRENMVKLASEIKFEDFDFMGYSSEGAVFNNGVDSVVVRVIVKAENFDFEDAIAEREENIKKKENEKKNKKGK